MNRRDLLIIGAGAVAWPLAARAQQKKMSVIGYLSSWSARPTAAFRSGLSETGYVEGQNVAIEYREAGANYDRLPALAADLVGRNVDMIVATGGFASAQAAKNATSTIPIVFLIGSDPVEGGLVTSFARPGTNLTGITLLTADLHAKRLELLSELVPHATVIALLVDSRVPGAERVVKEVNEAATAKGLKIAILRVTTASDIDAAFPTVVPRKAGALLVTAAPFLDMRREQLLALAAEHAVPAIYAWRDMVAAGGLASYGASLTSVYHQLGSYAGKILKGAKPADLPVLQPTTFELVINLKTAKALGLTMPQSLLMRADEVIE